ncbi:hypothetical protein HYX08_03195 [Candidatus Woesearchaeota archaeon]|nr:hypothetical protein [Candidatus Woesearchaeota archaeon]
MEIIHNLGILSIKKNAEGNAGFVLANKKGSYCSFFDFPSSRYQGLFYFDEESMNMYKLIENIELNNNDVSGLKNGFYFAERRKEGIVELFLMPKSFNSLIYELSSEEDINLILDCKESFDNREWGRHYEILEEKGCIIIKFTKKTDGREDASDGAEEFSLYLAIKSNSNIFQKNDEWVERHYGLDEHRNSMPFRRHVYNALKLNGSKFVFSMSKVKNKAIKECIYLFSNIGMVKSKEKENFFEMLKKENVKKIINSEKIAKEAKVAYVSALNSLNNLIVDNENFGLFAGFPWFFQFWSRDTGISLMALSGIDKDFSKKLLFGYLNKIGNDGRLPNLAGKHASISLGNADAHGWLFLRCNEFVREISKNKEIISSIKKSIATIKKINTNPERIKDYIKKCNSIIGKKEDEYHKFLYEIESALEKSVLNLLKFHTKNTFEANEKLETWMDTSVDGDAREGARIEVQALRLNMYKLMFEITRDEKYRILENLLKNNVKNKLWDGKTLADGLGDFTARPNTFIAAYAYPELLSQKEWEICFENALKSLWLGWGGVSTIDKNHPLFTEENTGENIKSYHRGDSWFWINNLTALVLNRNNKIKFKKQIQKIIDASTEEILWKGCIGCHSELSSAKELRSEGCFSQAWSSAMFIEMVDKIYR